MKFYPTLSDALKAIYRRPNKQVISILNINSKAYVVFRSSLSKEEFLKKAITNKFLIADKINKNRFINYQCDPGTPREKRKKVLARLESYINMHEAEHFLDNMLSLHSEENLILNFPKIIELYAQHYPAEKINFMEIYLSHSPCSEHSKRKKFSQAREIDHLDQNGCEKKLEVFFKENYKYNHFSLFANKPRIKVKYFQLFDPAYHYSNDLFQEMDPILKNTLAPVFK